MYFILIARVTWQQHSFPRQSVGMVYDAYIGSAWSHFAYGRAIDNLTIVTKKHVAEVQELSSDVETWPLLILNLGSQRGLHHF